MHKLLVSNVNGKDRVSEKKYAVTGFCKVLVFFKKIRRGLHAFAI